MNNLVNPNNTNAPMNKLRNCRLEIILTSHSDILKFRWPL